MTWTTLYLTAHNAGEVGLLWREDVKLGLVGSLALILSTDLQGESVVVSDVELLAVAAANQRTEILSSYC